MTGIIHFETFILAGLLLNMTPGNDTIFILSRSIAQGRIAGFYSVLGITTGSLVHTILAAFGLSVIIAKSLVLFNVIKYAGAAYLLYLGFKMIVDRTGLRASQTYSASAVNFLKIYRDAMITNMLNPKVALFFIAFLPQFIDPAAGKTELSFVILGLTFCLTGAIWSSVLVGFAHLIFKSLTKNQKLSSYLNKSCGAVLVALGIKVALTSNS